MNPAFLLFIAIACATLSAADSLRAAADEVTFTEHIAPLVHQHCASCHRPGQAGPFPLLTYEEVSGKARTMARVMDRRYMPPWHPAEGHVRYQGERRLADEEIARFHRWIELGKPEGPGKAPAPPAFPDGWRLGEPDLVVSMKEAFPVPAEGSDVYRNFAIPLNLAEDKWVSAVELRPSARGVVHHSLFFLDSSGEAVRMDGEDGKPGFHGMGFRRSGSLGGYVPGTTPRHLPDGLAMPLPKESDLVLATHFHPNGKPERERSTVGIYFADEHPSRPLVSLQVPPAFGRGMGIDIPPGETDYRVRDEMKLPVAVDAVSVGGHAHYLCREMTMTAILPSGDEQVLLEIRDWDLNWQDRYLFANSIRLPAGTTLRSELIYDNSTANPDNPFYPPRRVRWGNESTDEMGSITLLVTPAKGGDEQALRRAARQKRVEVLGAVLRNPRETLALGLTRKISRLDRNGDGVLQRGEIPPRVRETALRRFDRDRSDTLEKTETDRLIEAYRSGERLFP